MKEKDLHHHKTRDLLKQCVYDHPGISFKELRDRYDLNVGTLRYHLNFLIKDGIIFKKKIKNNRCYFASAYSLKGKYHGICTDGCSDIQKRIIEIIDDNPGISRSELARNSRLSKKVINYNLRRLKEDKLIWKTEDGSDPCYELITKEKLIDEVLLILIDKLMSEEIDSKTFLILVDDIMKKRN